MLSTKALTKMNCGFVNCHSSYKMNIQPTWCPEAERTETQFYFRSPSSRTEDILLKHEARDVVHCHSLNHDYCLNLSSLQPYLSFVGLIWILALTESKTPQQGQKEPEINQQPLADKQAARPPGLSNQHCISDNTLPNHSWIFTPKRL